MDRDPSPRIVLGETDPAGFLRFLLEAEGLAVVGLATSDDELRRVLRGVRPSVVVLDAGISAPAALEIRETFPDTSLVVVWPTGVAAVLAHHRVDPDDAVEQLGDAVRLAAARAADVVASQARRSETPPHIRVLVGDDISIDVAEVEEETVVSPAPVFRSTRRRRLALPVTAGVWLLYLMLAAAIAVAVPGAIDLYRSARDLGGHAPPASASARGVGTASESPDGVATSEPTSTRSDDPKDEGQMPRTTCLGHDDTHGKGQNRNDHADRPDGCSDRGPHGAEQHGSPDDPGNQGQGKGKGQGKGHGQGQGRGQGKDSGGRQDRNPGNDQSEHGGGNGGGNQGDNGGVNGRADAVRSGAPPERPRR